MARNSTKISSSVAKSGWGGVGRGGLVPEFYEFADSGWGHPKLGLGSTLDLQGRGGFKGIP